MNAIKEVKLDVYVQKWIDLNEWLKNYDNNSDGYITKDEYETMIRTNRKYIYNIDDLNVTENETSFSEGCVNDEEVNNYIDQFFLQYDKNNDGKIHISELLDSVTQILETIDVPKGTCTF